MMTSATVGAAVTDQPYAGMEGFAAGGADISFDIGFASCMLYSSVATAKKVTNKN